MSEKNSNKIPKKYVCENCDYNTCNKKDYNKHLLTPKHIILINTDNKIPKIPIKCYKCICGKIYKHSQSLYTHKKKCSYNGLNINKKIDNNDNVKNDNVKNDNVKNDNIDNYKELVMKLMIDNEEIKNLREWSGLKNKLDYKYRKGLI